MPKKILIIDNYDSFTYNLVDYLSQCGAECMVIKNDTHEIDFFESLEFGGIVLSPGPCVPATSGITMAILHKYHSTRPILGVCLGHQAIGEYFGAKLVKAERPMHGKVSEISLLPHKIFENIPSKISVMRYHSLIITDIENTKLIPLAYSEKQEIMAMYHPKFNVVGVQFHPESILSQYGKEMLSNWLMSF